MHRKNREPRGQERLSTRYNPQPRNRHEAQLPVEVLYRLR
jgi:hypothetical protein